MPRPRCHIAGGAGDCCFAWKGAGNASIDLVTTPLPSARRGGLHFWCDQLGSSRSRVGAGRAGARALARLSERTEQLVHETLRAAALAGHRAVLTSVTAIPSRVRRRDGDRGLPGVAGCRSSSSSRCAGPFARRRERTRGVHRRVTRRDRSSTVTPSSVSHCAICSTVKMRLPATACASRRRRSRDPTTVHRPSRVAGASSKSIQRSAQHRLRTTPQQGRWTDTRSPAFDVRRRKRAGEQPTNVSTRCDDGVVDIDQEPAKRCPPVP